MKFMDYLWKKRHKQIFIPCLLLVYCAYLSARYYWLKLNNCYIELKQKFDAKVKASSHMSLGLLYCVYHQSTWNRSSRIEPG